MLDRGGLDQTFDVHSRRWRRDVVGEAVGVAGALQAGSQRLIRDFSTAVGLIWGGRASDVYSGGHSSGCALQDSVLECVCVSICVYVCVCVGGEVREWGIDADAGLTTVLAVTSAKMASLGLCPYSHSLQQPHSPRELEMETGWREEKSVKKKRRNKKEEMLQGRLRRDDDSC